jgi:hypothetical protein
VERREGRGATIIAFPAARARPTAELGDLRFRALLGEAAWATLPAATCARFGKRIADCRAALYAGEIVECRMNLAGRILAQAARLIGGPLPLSCDADLPAMVAVTEDAAGGGQIWTRVYGRRRGVPQVINSCKRFAGPTGLEEHVGRGFGIALRVEVADGALHFIGDHSFLAALGLRLRIPHWLAPGRLVVSHIDCNHGLFAFMLVLTHSWFGEMIRQTAMFRDATVEEG